MATWEEIVLKMEQANSLIYATEGAMIEANAEVEINETFRRFTDLFYVTMNQLKEVTADLKEFEGHRLVVSAIEAVNNVEALKAENKALKEYIEKVSA